MEKSKRRFIKQTFGLMAATSLVAGGTKHAAAAGPPEVPPSMKGPGAGMGEYGTPAKYERKVTRAFIRSQPGTTGSGASRTPLESLDGRSTSSGLHFERHHSGVPDIDPDQHRLLIHGLVKRPLIFTVDALPPLSNDLPDPLSRVLRQQRGALTSRPHRISRPGETHGLVSCSEWTGVSLRLLLEEAGRRPGAHRGCSPRAGTPPR